MSDGACDSKWGTYKKCCPLAWSKIISCLKYPSNRIIYGMLCSPKQHTDPIWPAVQSNNIMARVGFCRQRISSNAEFAYKPKKTISSWCAESYPSTAVSTTTNSTRGWNSKATIIISEHHNIRITPARTGDFTISIPPHPHSKTEQCTFWACMSPSIISHKWISSSQLPGQTSYHNMFICPAAETTGFNSTYCLSSDPSTQCIIIHRDTKVLSNVLKGKSIFQGPKFRWWWFKVCLKRQSKIHIT